MPVHGYISPLQSVHYQIIRDVMDKQIGLKRGSVLGLRLPGLESRIFFLCLEGGVILFISPSSGSSPGPVMCTKVTKKTHLFYLYIRYEGEGPGRVVKHYRLSRRSSRNLPLSPLQNISSPPARKRSNENNIR